MTSSDGTTRRSWIKKTGAGVIVLSGLAGCSGNGDGDGGGGDGGSSQVEFWTQETQEARVERINEIADNFVEQYDDEAMFDVNGVASEDYASEFLARQAADDLFELSQIGLPQVAPLRGSNVPARDLHEDVVERIEEKRDYDPFFLELFRDEQGLTAVPLVTWTMAAWYRQSAFDEAGLDFVPRTFDQLLEAAEALHDPDNGQFGIGIGKEAGDLYTQQCYSMFALANNAPLFSEDGEIIFDSDAHIETLQFYADLAEFTSPGFEGNAFIQYGNGQTHITPVAPHILKYVWDIADNPEEEVNDIRHTGYVEEERKTAFGLPEGSYMINANADENAKQVAADFLEYWAKEEYMNWLDIQIGGFQPVFQGFTETEEYRNHEIMQHVDESVIQAIEESIMGFERFGGYIHGEYFPIVGEIENQFIIADAAHDVIRGEDPQQVAEDYAEEMRSLRE